MQRVTASAHPIILMTIAIFLFVVIFSENRKNEIIAVNAGETFNKIALRQANVVRIKPVNNQAFLHLIFHYFAYPFYQFFKCSFLPVP